MPSVGIASEPRERDQFGKERIQHELDGLKLIVFGIWKKCGGNARSVTFPARQYAFNNERRSFALVRPVVQPHRIGCASVEVLEVYTEYEGQSKAAFWRPVACTARSNRI